MNPDERSADVAAYAGAVRAALADLPPVEGQALLEDLDDHLAEVAAESDVPLAERLGPPAAYAAELRAAYGAAHSKPRRPGDGVQRMRDALAGWLSRSWTYREVRAFLPELRPAWWVLRAYLVVLIAAVAFSGRSIHPIPDPFSSLGLLEIVATIAAIAVSVRLGRRGQPHGRLLSPAALAANWLVALLAIPALASMGTSPTSGMAEPAGYPVVDQAVYPGSPFTNVDPYSRDGTPQIAIPHRPPVPSPSPSPSATP